MAVRWLLLFAVFGLGDAASVTGKSETTSYDTIVVGLGAAGTTAATTLARAGLRVLGLEAQGRIGGRVNTVDCDNGVLELGAEWIHGIEGSPTYQLAVENNVTVLTQVFNESAVWSDGRAADNKVLAELMYVTLDHDVLPASPESVGDYLTKVLRAYLAEHHPNILNDTDFIDEYLSFADLVVDSYIGSDSWFDACTHSRYEELGGSQDTSWHRHGYRTLFDILLNKYKDGPGLPTLTVKLNTEVTQIVWPQDPAAKVVVKTKDGAEYTADNVIVTVSVGVLQERYKTLFSPELPPKKATAIESISIGVVDKVVLLFSERWWPENSSFGFLWRAEDKRSVGPEDGWVTKIAGVSAPMGCDRALTLWTNGVAARHMETLSEGEVKSKTMDLLRRFLGANYTITEPTAIYRTTWYSNPFTRGSYSFDNLLTPQHPTARADLAEPLTDTSGEPRLLFAGEASHPTHYSTVHGAVGSGRREANRLLKVQEDPVRTSQEGRTGTKSFYRRRH